MGKRYKNPPIEEALCEFQFIPNQPWDLTVPGLIYDRLKEEFPDKEQHFGLGVQVQPAEKGFEQKVEPAPPRIRFLRKDRRALVQVAPDLLVINQLKPYPTWAEFRPKIIENLNRYGEVGNPKGFKRIGLRYINKIDLKAGTNELGEYLNFFPSVPNNLSQPQSGFIARVELPYQNHRDRLLLTIGSTLPRESESLTIILDVEYILADSDAVPIQNAGEWIELAHSTIEEAFESCISEKTRMSFGEIK